MSETVDSGPTSANPFTHSQAELGNGIARPTGVTITAILCCVGGFIGILTSVMQVAQTFVGQQFAAAMIPDGPAGDRQRELIEQLAAINQKFLIPNIGISTASFAICICLIVGGAALLMPRKWAPRWLRRALVAAIILEVLRQIVYAVSQFQLYPVMLEQSFTFVSDGQDVDAAPPEFMKFVQSVAMTVVYVSWGVWFLVKLSIMIWGHRYLKRDYVQAYCSRAAT